MWILDKVQVVKKVYDHILGESAEKFDLTINEVKVILYLAHTKKNNTAKDIADNLMISKSHVSMSVNNLEKRGYLLRKNDDKDKKKLHLVLTEKSDIVVRDIKKIKNNVREKVLKDISVEELELVESISLRMRKNLDLIMDLKDK